MIIFLNFFKKLFSEITNDLSVRYIDIKDRNEIENEAANSKMNLNTATVIVFIVERNILESSSLNVDNRRCHCDGFASSEMRR